jgi:hypothetical protein
MNLIQLKAIKDHLNDQIKQLNSIQINCLHCKHFSTKCEQYDSTPPLDWVHGTVDCELWEWDYIPF